VTAVTEPVWRRFSFSFLFFVGFGLGMLFLKCLNITTLYNVVIRKPAETNKKENRKIARAKQHTTPLF
jgi:hypothetical protein